MTFTLYRVMCQAEYDRVSNSTPFSWYGKNKWFTDNLTFIQERVLDGKFNNSNHKPDKYTHLVRYELNNLNGFNRVSDNELMLKRHKVPLTSINQVTKLGNLNMFSSINIPNSRFIKSTQYLPDPNKYVIIKLEPLYEGDMDIYRINFRTPCTCKRSFTGECKELVWFNDFNFYEPFEWCYINFQE